MKAWLKSQELSEDNIMAFYVTKIDHTSDRVENFTYYELDELLERHSQFEEEQPEDSDIPIYEWDEKAEIYKELKEHCIRILGEEYFKE